MTGEEVMGRQAPAGFEEEAISCYTARYCGGHVPPNQEGTLATDKNCGSTDTMISAPET